MHFFAVVLWVAAGLAASVGLGTLAVAIVAVVVVNAVFTSIQQGRTDRALDQLREMVPRRCRVWRDAAIRDLEVSELVPGDLIVLVAGDRVPADARVTQSALGLDVSVLTGERDPVTAAVGDLVAAGTVVVAGESEAEVVATANATRFAQVVALSTRRTAPRSPLTVELHRTVRTMSMVAIGAGSAMGLVALGIGQGTQDAAVFTIGVAVALIPEGLLPTLTLSLALGAERMARRGALVRHLDAVESLGSTTFLCLDKTGTLTSGRLVVADTWFREGEDPVAIAAGAARGVGRSDQALAAALEGHAEDLGADLVALEIADPELARRAFDPATRIAEIDLGSGTVMVGAPESVFARAETDPSARSALEVMTRRARRVLAVAHRRGDHLVTVALVGLEDPPRPGVPEALADCTRLGIRLAMITGDHPATAEAIAKRVGLGGREGPRVLVASDLPEDPGAAAALVDHDGIVIARATPEDKVVIAQALASRGHVVAMTGDGVNDVPALHLADVGVAMGRSGSDAAREAADLILLDDDVSTIVVAVREGRTTYANIGRFLTYHLTDNVAEVAPLVAWALSGGAIPLALGVLQILALDLGTDTLSAVALGAEPPRDPTIGEGPSAPITTRLLDRTVLVRAFGRLGPAEVLAEAAAFATAYALGAQAAGASGAVFVTVVVCQSANAWACRSDRLTPWRLGWGTNRLLVVAVAVEAVLATGFVAIPAVAEQLGHRPPPLGVWSVAALGAVLLWGVDAGDKARRVRCDVAGEPPPPSHR